MDFILSSWNFKQLIEYDFAGAFAFRKSLLQVAMTYHN